MIFNSVDYLIFFPIVVLGYYVIPKKARNIWLLIASYYFYMNWNMAYALLLLASTVITFGASLLVDKAIQMEKQKWAKLCMAASFFLNLGILVYFKYTNFIIENVNQVTRLFGKGETIGAFDIVLPVGISFYIFQALGYTMDVNRGQIRATKNIFRYALFVSFFPQLVAGPIERSRNLLGQFDEEHTFEVDRVREGLLQMALGLFLKIVIADNLSVMVTKVFDNYLAYSGMQLFVAVALFAFQIYCDFGGYSAIAIGSAKVLGFRLMENFDAPYLSASVHGFWKRWHISLTSWFTDYLYIPLGGNRKGKVRKYINVMIIFLVSGLWHGANWTYVIWGGLNGLYMVLEEMTVSIRVKSRNLLHIAEGGKVHALLGGLITFVLVDFSWLFFRAESFTQVLGIMRQAKANFGIARLFADGVGVWGIDYATMVALGLAFVVLLGMDICRRCGKNVYQMILTAPALLRYLTYAFILGMIMYFGVYGYEYAQTAFIYFQF